MEAHLSGMTAKEIDQMKSDLCHLEKLLFDLKQWAEKQKTDHELPNQNDSDYNRGYVKAMNDLINRLK